MTNESTRLLDRSLLLWENHVFGDKECFNWCTSFRNKYYVIWNILACVQQSDTNIAMSYTETSWWWLWVIC